MPRVERTDSETITRNHEERITAIERNGGDPKEWIYVGSGAPAPAFQNGFGNAGGALMRYRFLRTINPALDPSVYTPNSIELQGAVVGGAHGQTIFTLLAPSYLPGGTPAWTPVTRDAAVHLTVCDDIGGFQVITVQSNGDVVYGFV